MPSLNYEFNPHFHNLDTLDVPSHIPTHSPNHNQALSIAPWDDSQNTQGIVNGFRNFTAVKKNHSDNYYTKDPQNKDILNFVNGIPKGRKNRSDLGKLTKNLEQNKGQNYHLNLNKIEFLQYQKNQANPYYRKSLYSNPKSAVKDFSSIENNFFIKSYFFPNNPKMTTKKEQNLYLQAKRQKEYRKIKQIKGLSFIATKSVDLKHKFPVENNEEKDSDSETDLQTERFYSTFRTVSVLGSRKNRRTRNVSIQQNYSPSLHMEYQKYKTIESTKESYREMTESIKEKNLLNLDEKLIGKISKGSKNPVIIMANSSFIRKRESRKSVKMNLSSSKLEEMDDSEDLNQAKRHKNTQKSSQDRQEIHIKSTKKQFTISMDKTSRIDRLKQLKQKNELQNFLQIVPPYGQEKSKKLFCSTQRVQISQRSPPKQKRAQKEQKSFQIGSKLRKKMDTSNMNKTLKIFDRMHPIQKVHLH